MSMKTESTSSTNEHGHALKAEFNWEMFSTPSGNIAGIATAQVTTTNGGKKARQRRVAHAYLFTDAAPEVSLEVPPKATLAEVTFIGHALLKFVDKVNELDATRQQSAPATAAG